MASSDTFAALVAARAGQIPKRASVSLAGQDGAVLI
jgi:hypothetical protein